jgi:glyoxylase-like metal-dependent hydrolase (beta-lactamase superfamily II)
VTGHDTDWFSVQRIDDGTYAILEPRYWEHVASFLLLGTQRALLFDSGSGRHDIRPIVRSLTDLPVTVTCSHPHFDHIGNHHRFERVALLDHPRLRERVRNGVYRPSFFRTLKPFCPAFPVTEWWADGETVDLGGRELAVIHVPGHMDESIALLDRGRDQLFLGDFLYNEELLAVDLGAYQRSVQRLLDLTTGRETLFGAHGSPVMPFRQLEALAAVLGDTVAGRTRPRLAQWLGTPLRRVQSGEIELWWVCFGRWGLLFPWLLVATALATLAAGVGALSSWVAAPLILLAGYGLLIALSRRL